ncbi:hypothetical protein SERLADRAFT_479687, partial [Serpula lacrymans var. lacrymans S7.9]
MNSLPIFALDASETPGPGAGPSDWVDDYDSDSDAAPQVSVVTSFTAQAVLPRLDLRTRKRLQTLPSSSHLNALLKASQRYRGVLSDLMSFLLGVCIIWPAQRSKVLGSVLVYGGGGIVREIYREHVRNSPL